MHSTSLHPLHAAHEPAYQVRKKRPILWQRSSCIALLYIQHCVGTNSRYTITTCTSTRVQLSDSELATPLFARGTTPACRPRGSFIAFAGRVAGAVRALLAWHQRAEQRRPAPKARRRAWRRRRGCASARATARATAGVAARSAEIKREAAEAGRRLLLAALALLPLGSAAPIGGLLVRSPSLTPSLEPSLTPSRHALGRQVGAASAPRSLDAPGPARAQLNVHKLGRVIAAAIDEVV